MTDIKHSQLVRNWKLFLITQGIKTHAYTSCISYVFTVLLKHYFWCLFWTDFLWNFEFHNIVYKQRKSADTSENKDKKWFHVNDSSVITGISFSDEKFFHELSINLILGSYKVGVHKNNLKSLLFLDCLNMYIHYFRSVRCIAFQALEVSNQSSLCWCRSMSITLHSNFLLLFWKVSITP